MTLRPMWFSMFFITNWPFLCFFSVAIINFPHQQRRGWKGVSVTESNNGLNFCFTMKLFYFALKQFINALDVLSNVNNITLRFWYLRYTTCLIEIESYFFRRLYVQKKVRYARTYWQTKGPNKKISQYLHFLYQFRSGCVLFLKCI